MQIHTRALAFLACAITADASCGALTLEAGHLYATTEQAIWQFAGDGSMVGSLDIPGGELRGVAIGPDELLYVVREISWGSSVVEALTLGGEEQRTIPIPAPGLALASDGKLCFDFRRRIGYAIFGTGSVRFSIDGGDITNWHYAGHDCTVLPDGSILIGTGGALLRVSRNGDLIETIEELVDASGGPFSLSFAEVHGVHYAEDLEITYATTSHDRLLSLRGTSNEIIKNVYFRYGADISTTREKLVLVGSSTTAPALFTHDLMLAGNVDGQPGYFVAAYPPSTVVFVGSFE